MKARIRTTLKASLKPKLGLGTQLLAIGRSLGGANIEIRRDPTPIKPATFA
jgi:antitoxin FitA